MYRAEGFNEPEGEIETVLSVGRRVGRTMLIGNVAYGQDPKHASATASCAPRCSSASASAPTTLASTRAGGSIRLQTAKLMASREPTYESTSGRWRPCRSGRSR